MLTAHLNQKISDFIPTGDSFAIAFSGGGDSTALLHALKDHPQSGRVYIVDHDLRRGSGVEAKAAQSFARSCGYAVKVLKWRHEAPTSALQEKARKARYGMMGAQCREDGIKYLLTAHSEDDQAETLLMRYERKTDWRGAAGMAEMTYGPLWPELAMVNVVRPLLGISRQALRDYNKSHNLSWAEDPSNQNRDYARIRARDLLLNKPILRKLLLDTATELKLGVQQEKSRLLKELESCSFGESGEVTFLTMPSLELLGLTLRCVGGGSSPIDRKRLNTLRSKLLESEKASITMLGAQAVRYGDAKIIISRDPVAVMGRKDGNMEPSAVRLAISSKPQIWDGRFLVKSETKAFNIQPRYGLDLPRTRHLDDYIRSLPKSVRPTMPVLTRSLQAYAPSDIAEVQLVSLVESRLHAALGLKTP